MAISLANIKVGITLSSKSFNRNLKKSSRSIKRFNNDLRSLKRLAIGAAGIFGLQFGARSLLGIFNERRGVIDKVGKFADELGFSTDRLTELQFAAKLTGTNVQILNKGLQIFIRRIGEARQGTGEARKGMDRLGLSADQLASMSTNKAFRLVADRINMLGTQAEKSGIAFMFFSRQGQDLLNLFQLGSKGFDEITALVESFGGALNRFETKKVEEMNDSFERLILVLDIAKDRFISILAPAIDFITKKFQDAIRPVIFIDKSIDHLRITIEKFRKPISITLNLIKIFVLGLGFAFNFAATATLGFLQVLTKLINFVSGPFFKQSLNDIDEFFGTLKANRAQAGVKNLKEIFKTFSAISDSKLLKGLEDSLKGFDLLASGKPDSLVNTLEDIEKQAKATIKALNFQQVVRQFKALNDQSTDLSFLSKELKKIENISKASPLVDVIIGNASKAPISKRRNTNTFGNKLIPGLMGPITPTGSTLGHIVPGTAGSFNPAGFSNAGPGKSALKSLGMSALAFGTNPAGLVGHGVMAALIRIAQGIDKLNDSTDPDRVLDKAFVKGMTGLGFGPPGRRAF